MAVAVGKLLRPLPLLRNLQHLQTAPSTDDTPPIWSRCVILVFDLLDPSITAWLYNHGETF